MAVETVEEAVAALPRVVALDRRAVRRRFEQRFSAARMAQDYVGVYRKLLSQPDEVEPISRHAPAATPPLAPMMLPQTFPAEAGPAPFDRAGEGTGPGTLS
jgi:hypothetical protein